MREPNDWDWKKYFAPLLLVVVVAGCSTNAEFKRPEDVTALRASYTEASMIYSVFVGGTTVCQITALDRDGNEQQDPTLAAALIADYGVVLDKDGCSIMPKTMLEGL